MAFEQGFLHPETRILDRPTRFGNYGPGNFDGRYQGWVSVREALQRSLNLPAVQVLERTGPHASCPALPDSALLLTRTDRPASLLPWAAPPQVWWN